MLGVQDGEMESAAEKLANHGFVRQNWSFSSSVDPATRQNDEIYKRIHEGLRPAFANFDAHSIRFRYPDKQKFVQQTVLIPSSYMYLSVSQSLSDTFENRLMSPNTSVQPPFYIHNNLYYPNPVVLMQSVIKVCIEERARTDILAWQAKLASWAGYLYWELSLRDDILNTCRDSKVKEFFDLKVKSRPGSSRTREKWGKPKTFITNDLIKDFQISPGCTEEVAKIGQITIETEERENHED